MPRSIWLWMLVDELVNNFNKYSSFHYVPSDLICVGKSISEWYILGVHWINMVIPMYVAIGRNPLNGCQIQNSCDAISQVMMQLKLVKLEAAYDR